MNEDVFEGVAAETLAAAKAQKASKAAQREASALDAAEKARMREEALDVLREAVRKFSEASSLLERKRILMYGRARDLHNDHGVSWKDLAVVVGKTPEALIKGSGSRGGLKPIAVDGLPHGWILRIGYAGYVWAIEVDGIVYSPTVRGRAKGPREIVFKEELPLDLSLGPSNPWGSPQSPTEVAAEEERVAARARHIEAPAELRLTNEQLAVVATALQAFKKAAEKRSTDAKARKNRPR
jgi:hypothetical protein